MQKAIDWKRPGPWLMIVAGLVAYANSMVVPFLFDDFPAIVNNASIRSWSPPWEVLSAPPFSAVSGRPIVNLTLALNYAVSGLAPWSYHVFNLALHIANALLLYALVRRTAKGERVEEWALAAATLWLLHPLLTESVTYVIQRTELLMAFFLLLTLMFAISGRNFLAVIACALGMGCKEVMAVAPLIVLLYDRTWRAGSFREAFRQRGKFYAALAATWLVLAASVIGNARKGSVGLGFTQVTPWRYVLTQCGVVLQYLRLSVWPHPLLLDYNGWPLANSFADVWMVALVILGLIGLTVWALARRPVCGFFGAAFFLILAPSSSVVPIITEIAAERRMYLPLISVIFLVVAAMEKMQSVVWRRGMMIGLAVLWCGLTIHRNADYRTALTIWQDTVAKAPRNARAHSNLGKACEAAGQSLEALRQYAMASALDPMDARNRYNFATALAQAGKTEAAIDEFQAAIAIYPQYAEAHYNLGVALNQLGKNDQSREQFAIAARLRGQ